MANSDSARFAKATQSLQSCVDRGIVESASVYLRNRDFETALAFGKASSPDAVFLIASITKPIATAALMTLHERGLFDLAAPACKYLPEFTGDGRETIRVEQLLTHVSGLPDQLPENAQLRSEHQPLSAFVDHAIRTPLKFAPGSRYSYSSMAILLACEIGRRVSGASIESLVHDTVLKPLGMRHSALGLGEIPIDSTMQCQVEKSAPESGAGAPDTKDWDWNSAYWRNLGAPWGGGHASAPDIGRFLASFVDSGQGILNLESIKRMTTNQNPSGLRPRGLGFVVGPVAGSPSCSERTFGHDGATGTTAWCDPESETICVVLTTLPAGAVKPHPRDLFSDQAAAEINR